MYKRCFGGKALAKGWRTWAFNVRQLRAEVRNTARLRAEASTSAARAAAAAANRTLATVFRLCFGGGKVLRRALRTWALAAKVREAADRTAAALTRRPTPPNE